MAGKFSIYKYVMLAGKGWRYASAAYHPNGKIKPDAVLVKGVNGKDVEKHPEGSYFLNFNNMWIPVGEDEAQHQRKLKLNELEYERLSGKTLAPGPNVIHWGGVGFHLHLLNPSTFPLAGANSQAKLRRIWRKKHRIKRRGTR